MLARAVLVASFLCAPLVAQENDALVRKVDDHYNHLTSLRLITRRVTPGWG